MTDRAAGAPVAMFRRIQESPLGWSERAAEHCHMCLQPIAENHGHIIDRRARHLLCACPGCCLLFISKAGGVRYRAVPDRYVSFPDLRLSMGAWEALQIPAGVAFLFQNSALERMAVIYPGPAGATESELALDRWTAMVAANPGLESLEDDVEAVLVRAAPGEEAPECFIVPIDTCYELVGRLRQLWRGVDGGCEARSETEAYFTRVRARAESIAGAPTHGQEQT